MTALPTGSMVRELASRGFSAMSLPSRAMALSYSRSLVGADELKRVVAVVGVRSRHRFQGRQHEHGRGVRAKVRRGHTSGGVAAHAKDLARLKRGLRAPMVARETRESRPRNVEV